MISIISHIKQRCHDYFSELRFRDAWTNQTALKSPLESIENSWVTSGSPSFKQTNIHYKGSEAANLIWIISFKNMSRQVIVLLMILSYTNGKWPIDQLIHQLSINSLVSLAGDPGLPAVTKMPWLHRNGSNFAYQFNSFTTQENYWTQANEWCLAQASRLVTILDRAELAWLLQHYPTFPTIPEGRDRTILIGLVRDRSLGIWKWLGEPKLIEHDRELLRWQPNEPVGHDGYDCAILSAKLQTVRAIHCELTANPLYLTRFVCKTNADELWPQLTDKLNSVAGQVQEEKNSWRKNYLKVSKD